MAAAIPVIMALSAGVSAVQGIRALTQKTPKPAPLEQSGIGESSAPAPVQAEDSRRTAEQTRARRTPRQSNIRTSATGINEPAAPTALKTALGV